MSTFNYQQQTNSSPQPPTYTPPLDQQLPNPYASDGNKKSLNAELDLPPAYDDHIFDYNYNSSYSVHPTSQYANYQYDLSVLDNNDDDIMPNAPNASELDNYTNKKSPTTTTTTTNFSNQQSSPSPQADLLYNAISSAPNNLLNSPSIPNAPLKTPHGAAGIKSPTIKPVIERSMYQQPLTSSSALALSNLSQPRPSSMVAKVLTIPALIVRIISTICSVLYVICVAITNPHHWKITKEISIPTSKDMPYQSVRATTQNLTNYHALYSGLKRFLINTQTKLHNEIVKILWINECKSIEKRNKSWAIWLKRKDHKPLPDEPTPVPIPYKLSIAEWLMLTNLNITIDNSWVQGLDSKRLSDTIIKFAKKTNPVLHCKIIDNNSSSNNNNNGNNNKNTISDQNTKSINTLWSSLGSIMLAVASSTFVFWICWLYSLFAITWAIHPFLTLLCVPLGIVILWILLIFTPSAAYAALQQLIAISWFEVLRRIVMNIISRYY